MFSGLCCSGAMPRRWAPPHIARTLRVQLKRDYVFVVRNFTSPCSYLLLLMNSAMWLYVLANCALIKGACTLNVIFIQFVVHKF